MKYELLLRDIYKHTERAGLVQELPSLQDAIYVMKVSVCLCVCVAQRDYSFPATHATVHSNSPIHYMHPHRLFQKRQMIWWM